MVPGKLWVPGGRNSFWSRDKGKCKLLHAMFDWQLLVYPVLKRTRCKILPLTNIVHGRCRPRGLPPVVPANASSTTVLLDDRLSIVPMTSPCVFCPCSILF